MYDRDGRLVSMEEGTSPTYQRTLDGPRIEILRDERGLLTRRELDGYRNPLRITYPDGSSESWSYHAQFSFPVEHIDARGTRTTWDYDAKGNLMERVVAAGTPEAQRTTYVYNAFGELTKMTIAGAAQPRTRAPTTSTTRSAISTRSPMPRVERSTGPTTAWARC